MLAMAVVVLGAFPVDEPFAQALSGREWITPEPGVQLAQIRAGDNPSPANVAMIRGQLEALVAQFDCAGLRVGVDADGVVRLRGSVQSERDRARLLTAAHRIEGTRYVDASVTVQAASACELRRVVGNATSPDFRIVLNKPNQPYRIRVDDLVFRVHAPRQGYLSIAFLNSEGTVLQFGPWTRIWLRSGGWATFGDKVEMSVDPPAGKLVIVAVMSGQPLFAETPSEIQVTAGYLAALRLALARQPGSIVSYAVVDTID